jgi:DNA-binding response OmpR family regulator
MPKILVVDDDHAIVQLLKANLETLGHEIMGAYDGIEALEIAGEWIPDLVILDYMLPRLDGFSVCRILKGNENTRSVPVIILTARSQVDDRVSGWESGADEFITKPFNYRELTARINSLLRIHELEVQLMKSIRKNAIADMVMTINHEINDPLAAILSHIQLIQSNSDPTDAEYINKHLAVIQKEAMSIRDIIHKLTEMSKSIPNEQISPSLPVNTQPPE